MTAIGGSSHAFFFDGVSDSIVVPQGTFTSLGHKKPEGGFDARTIVGESPHGDPDSGSNNAHLVVEAWVIPDCGGIVMHREGQFTLRIGDVDTPGPASFSVELVSDGRSMRQVLVTASEEDTNFDGTVFPPSSFGGIHDSYNRFNTSYDDATDMNRNHRPLTHLLGAFYNNKVQLYVNGELMASKEFSQGEILTVNESNSHIYVGGEGGQFRGAIESVHICNTYEPSSLFKKSPTANDQTVLLYRFEEPIKPIEETYTFSDTSGTIITVSTADATELAKKLTGKSTVSGTIDFTASPYSSGNYTVIQPGSAGSTTHQVPHVPFNLLINPNSINPNTRKPNGNPPERVRLESINTSNGQLTISSVHLDFDTASNGKRGLLHTSHTANVDNHFVVVSADMLVDSATGKPYQPPHYSTQVIDRTGQMVIDESGRENHGFVYSSRMATTVNDTDNPFAVTWPTAIDDRFSIGHSGRHIKNHIEGHYSMRILPPATEELVDIKSDGSADVVELHFDDDVGAEKQVVVNSELDIYRNLGDFEIKNIKNSSTVNTVYNSFQGVTITGTKRLIAIGGTGFDFEPFLLKGPSTAHFGNSVDEKMRKHHLRPSKESRVALLHVPVLRSTYNMAPYVEIHYNAIDITGASMDGSNTDLPLLMVEKTVPASTVDVGSGNYIYDLIASAMSGGATLYAPGGIIEIDTIENTTPVLGDSHTLVGDNSEGYDSDDELDESLTPVNHTPYAQTDAVQNTTPQIVQDSVSQKSEHNSVFNILTIGKARNKTDLVDGPSSSKRMPPAVTVNSPSNGEFDTGISAASSQMHEVFDIIDNVQSPSVSQNADMKLIVQPSDRRRTNQLEHVFSNYSVRNVSANTAEIHYLLSRTKVRSLSSSEDGTGGFSKILCQGVTEALSNATVDFRGKGSPDSHIVKEIEPNSPVVSVTLGGPGQGAMDINPTFDKSILAHAPYSTRRAYALNAIKYNTNSQLLYVEPLNNNSSDMSSWGTYGFPRYGRIHLPTGASARYEAKAAANFDFSYTATLGSGDFLSGDGQEFTTFTDLLKKEGYLISSASGNTDWNIVLTIMSESDFGSQSLIENGSTVNDRMFQAGKDVTHDYQLSTQYASTRALVEIPFFANQLFSDERNGVLVGPDNSFKIHLDATMTAHSWNPNPVGRRMKSVEQSDREIESAYSVPLRTETYVDSTTVESFTPPSYSTNGFLRVKDASIFPPAYINGDEFKGVDDAVRYRRVFLPNGEWCYYEDVNLSTSPGIGNLPNFQDHFLKVPKMGKYAYSEKFASSVEAGVSVSLSSPTPQNARKIGSDSYTTSSDYEGRGEYYYDSSNVKTQGGNVDYGLRKYVSAIELKAGPETNPHASRIENKRASGTILQAVQVLDQNHMTSGPNLKTWSITLSEEDARKFPQISENTVNEIKSLTDLAEYRTQDSLAAYLYEAQIGTTDGTKRAQYWGFLSNAAVTGTQAVDDNTITIVTYKDSTGNTWSPAIGDTITLTRKCNQILSKGQTISMGNNDHNAMHIEMKFATKNNSGYTVNTVNNSSTIAISGGANLLSANPTGYNFKTGDVLYEVNNDDYTYVGIIDYIEGWSSGSVNVHLTANTTTTGGKIAILATDYEDVDAILNTKWMNPYAAGGMRNGDTIWANMSYNNPHAVEGLFFKSRGVLNESQVWRGFNGGTGELDTTNPRDSIPLENFLIGNDCMETARNLVQHINKTVEENYKALGLTAAQAPTVAYVDPYLAKKGHARVLLYDVAHDREFIALQDIHMQVQTSPQATHIGFNRFGPFDGGLYIADLAKDLRFLNGNGPHSIANQIDVANGYPSQNRFIRSTQQSYFMEGAYAHNIANRIHSPEDYDTTSSNLRKARFASDGIAMTTLAAGKSHGHMPYTNFTLNGRINEEYVVPTYPGSGLTPRTQPTSVISPFSLLYHPQSRHNYNLSAFTLALANYRGEGGVNGILHESTFREFGTTFDTPDGTRVIPAFLCLKGIRSTSLDLSSHEEARLQHLPQWKDMDFVRRLTIDVGEIGQKEGVVDVLSGAEEMVRVINQYAALNGRVKEGSAHDPSSFWDEGTAFSSKDKGTHMGYLRAHLGREVQDLNGQKGHTIVIHSTVPGASGRNFCVWLDNSKGQTPYQPQFLVGHGGRWRNFWALPEEGDGENMHPAPMPLNKHGRPFAPITTLQQYIHPTETGEKVKSPNEFGTQEFGSLMRMSEYASGKSHNTSSLESLDVQGTSSTLVKGLRVGSKATARVNFGGLVASGIPGWAPNAGKFGFGNDGDNAFDKRYGRTGTATYSPYVKAKDKTNVGDGNIYGMQLEDHLGGRHGIRYIYKRAGDDFSNENTILPSTIDSEICVYFDDSDVSQGGFTLGRNMSGEGDATGGLTSGVTGDLERAGATYVGGNDRENATYKGNMWRGINAPAQTVGCTLSLSSETLTITLLEPYSSMTHDDKLGYLGYPKDEGMVQITATIEAGKSFGETFYYERREGNILYGVTGLSSVATSQKYQISPVLNWTTLVTDELIAAATAAAINADDVSRGVVFDCRDMYATDGRTFGEWGVSKDAVVVRSYKPDNDITPISSLFDASVFRDLGIHAAHMEFGEIQRATNASGVWDFDYDAPAFTLNLPSGGYRAFLDRQIDDSKQIDCGYLPFNVLQITTKGSGANTNTVTPEIVDSNNNQIETTLWRKNLQGEKFTRFPGDHILPMVDSPTALVDSPWVEIFEPITNLPLFKGDTTLNVASTADAAVGDIIATKTKVIGKIKTINTNTSFVIEGGIENDLPEKTIMPAGNIENTQIYYKNSTDDAAITGWQNTITLAKQGWNFSQVSDADGVEALLVNVGGDGYSGNNTLGGFNGTGNSGVPGTNPSTGVATTTDGRGVGLTLNFTWSAGTPITASITINNAGSGYEPTDVIYADLSSLNVGYTEWSGIVKGIAAANPKFRIFLNDESSIMVSGCGDANAKRLKVFKDEGVNWPSVAPFNDVLISRFSSLDNARKFDGLRSLGSVFSEPIVHFRGGKDSEDHSVPLFFGGGFSGAVMDVNDGTQNDYSSFYTHPYANGPTGSAGIQEANEILSSHAMIDCNAVMAFFPGTPLCNQHRASITPPFFNKDNMLTTDLDRGTSAYSNGVVKAKPIPLVMRFAHPTARYQDHRDGTDNKTTYIIFGPGQAFPFTREIADNTHTNHNTNEPCSGKVITNSGTWASVPRFSDFTRVVFPNQITNRFGEYLPEHNAGYHNRSGFHWKAVRNWETPAGFCDFRKSKQRPAHGRMYGQRITAETVWNRYLHPLSHNPFVGFGITRAADMVYHMDGGFHAGGSWMDDQITFNPKHPKKDTRITGGNSSSQWERDNQIHPTAFRVAGPLLGTIQDYVGGSTNTTIANTKMEYIVVDATRCQNGEELATVLGAAINAFPGAGALKALGGTHMPSMGNAMRQDRYGWINLGAVGTYNVSSRPYTVESATNASQTTLEEIPACGWLRANINTNDSTVTQPTYAAYHSRDVIKTGSNYKIRFYLAPNRKTGTTKFETTSDGSSTNSIGNSLFVWAKAGCIRFNNEDVSARDHMCQTHFSGIVDAVDRTKPIGAVGWHGERYSYLNSVKIDKATSGTGYAAGLGAYHPYLAFSPYGSAGTVMNTFGHLPVINPMSNSPESIESIAGKHTSAINVEVDMFGSPNTYTLASAPTGTYNFRDTEDTSSTGYFSTDPVNYKYKASTASVTNIGEPPEELTSPQGVFTSAFLVVAHESEGALVAKFDRDGVTATGDWLHARGLSSNPIQSAGTTLWDERIHGQDRFVSTANAGPNVEALIVHDMALPVGNNISGNTNWADDLYDPTGGQVHLHGAVSADTELENATPDRAKTGSILNDLDVSIGSINLHTSTDVERNVAADKYTTSFTSESGFANGFWMQDVNAYQMQSKLAAKNFTVENVVWKRMDGGSLTLPTVNARGLGAVPWVTRVSGNNAHTTGEKIFGNNRFSFETTNSAMLPVLQAQELSHPSVAKENPYPVNNVLNIPNEEIQFESITVVDDTGQEHRIEGGSPLGTIIRGFRVPTNRGTAGLAPALANSGNTPNLKIQLPNPNHIPGNIVVRSGFDPVQAYQGETMGSGGMQHPEQSIGHLFDNSVSNPRAHPTYEDHNWEHIDPLTEESTRSGWDNTSSQNSYEMHDRTLFFHITKMGHTHTHRYPTVYTHAAGLETNDLSGSSWNASTSVLTVSATIDTDVFDAGFGSKEVSDNRRFIRIYNPSTDEGVVASYTGISGQTFTGVVGDIDFTSFIASQTITNLKVVPSYYMPAGSARLFAANRLRDHAEVSGNSPDMAHTEYKSVGSIAFDKYSKPVMTPMPFPRMGHHFVNATMPMLPGHWSHPLYQSLYKRSKKIFNARIKTADSILRDDKIKTIASRPAVKSDLDITENINPLEAELNLGLDALPSGPSDLHGGGFALMFESAIRYDGYGVLATSGKGGVMNKVGGHSITLAAGANYTLDNHFPDPAEVGAYQIIIQPNLFASQLQGFNLNGGTYALTSQQVNTVIGIKEDFSNVGGIILILARATQADVRGCEVFMNEVLLDINPDYGSQFTKLPPLLLHNYFGINLHETPSFSRSGFPYSPKYSKATPGYTLNIPWWSVLFSGLSSDSIEQPDARAGTTQYAPHQYYQFSKSTYGSIGNQLTLQGYPSIYPDIYSKLLQNTSLIPKCTVISSNSGAGNITVDDATLFPVKPRFGEKLYFVAKDGNTYSAAYTKRDGHDADAINVPKQLEVTNSGEGATFYSNLYNGAVIHLSTQYNLFTSDNILKDTQKSVFANYLDSVIEGSKDTSSKHLPDAFICLWHPNLGKPYTYFSDDTSNRAWNASSYNAAMYNAVPEHFETIHYQQASYAMSLGPFSLKQKPPDANTKTGVLDGGDSTDSPGSTGGDFGITVYNRFWPCGTRGGPQASSLEEYVLASISWDKPGDYDSMKVNWNDADSNSYPYAVSSGITTNDRAANERRAFGYRVGLRQALNKPTWGIPAARAHLEGGSASGNAVLTTDYDAGPLVQHEAYTNGWLYKGGDSDGNATLPKSQVGILERLTNFTGMLGIDKPDDQVRYSDGRRMTRPFGVPLRTLRNPAPPNNSTGNRADRDWFGDGEGKGVVELSEAAQWYLVDWWANERGEDVRRAPVRGFGVRPAWDCGDAYEYDRTNSRSPYERVLNNGKPLFNLKNVVSGSNVSLSNGFSIPRFEGRLNDENNNSTTTLVDVFCPTNSLRVGDMGNGRGIRCPTHFNEDKLTALSTPIEKTGVVLSHNTSEPLFGDGLLRPRDDVLQIDEVPRGISSRLDITEDGLLKPEATVSDRVENIVGDSPHKDPISRSSPRIGIVGQTEDESDDSHVILNTEAHSLHTDRNVGQRVVLHGALQTTQSLANATFTGTSFSRQSNGSPVSAALRFSHTNPFRPYGGTYIMESKSYTGVFDDTGWGRNNLSGSAKTSNPYQKATTYNLNTKRNNNTDKTVRFLLRPIRLLDKQHVELFRVNNALHSSSPQYDLNYHYATSGGKYGLFNYEVTTGRNATSNYIAGSDPNSNGPYWPIYVFDETGAMQTPVSFGPNIPGSEVTGFDKTSLDSTVTRVLISENTLQHHRSDAARKRQKDDSDEDATKMDYNVKARYSQSLHSKGHKGDVSFSTSDHSGDAT
tara:strand:+ start:10163 stop:27070 length:16908 start_codon:yes stop_codon:yes gene_type:complete